MKILEKEIAISLLYLFLLIFNQETFAFKPLNNLPTIVIGDVTVIEGEDAIVPITLDTPSNVDTLVEVETISSTGTAGTDDFLQTILTVVIPAGEVSVEVIIPTIDDVTHEDSEFFTLSGTVTSTNTYNTDPIGTVTIIDNDSTPTILVGSITVTEGIDTVANVPVFLDLPSATDTVVALTTVAGTAGLEDYETLATTIVIPSGETNIDVIIPIIDDSIYEETETFAVIANVTSGNTANNEAEGIVIINDNEPLPATDDIDADNEPGTIVIIDPINNDNATSGNIDPTSVRLVDPSGTTTQRSSAVNQYSLVEQLSVPNEGLWSVDTETGLISFEPVSSAVLNPTPVEYVFFDTNGNLSNRATITIAYDASLSTSTFLDSIAFEVFPNPASDYLYFSGDFKGDVTLQLINTNGSKVKKIIGKQLDQITITELPSGVYFLQIIVADKVAVKQIIKL